MTTDTTFFTNEPNSTLVDRFKVLLKHSQFLDIIVGYFRISGFNLLKDSFENIDEVRILNGINVTYEYLFRSPARLEQSAILP